MPTLPSKKEVVLALLERSSVFIHLDPRRDRVVVPQWFKKQSRLVLQIGLNMPVPIRDLNVDDECISCTLSFNRSPHFCWIPWQAVFALVGEDQRGMLWPDDVPPELAQNSEENQSTAEEARKKADRPRLRAVTDSGGDGGADAKASTAGRSQPPGQPAAAGAREADLSVSVPPPQPAPEAKQETKLDTRQKSKRPSHLRLVK